MFKALTGSQLDSICGGKNDEPMMSPLPARAVAATSSLGSYATPPPAPAVAATSSLGSYATPLAGAATSTRLPPYITR